MSAIVDTPADAPIAVTPAERRQPAQRRPGVAVAVKVEVAKLTSQLPLGIALALCVVVPAAFAVLMRADSTRPSDTLFGRWSGTTGFATSLTMLSWAPTWAAPLLAGLFAGDIFASEDRHGTWKTILTRSSTRTSLFLGKAVAATVCVWFSFAVLAVVSVVASLAAEGSAPLVGLSGQLISPGRALGLVAASWALSLLWTGIFVALGLLLSIASRSGIVGVLGPLVVAIVLQLLEAISSGQVVRSALPTTPSEAWHVLFTAPLHAGPIVQAVVTCVGYTAVFAGAALYVLRRRDFAGADALPSGRRRAVVRITLAVAAVSVLLVGFSAAGPTTLTSERLDQSIATTFGNLVEVRYHWQSDAAADTTIPWQATCNRGGTPVGSSPTNSSGAGDDWSCTVVDLRASDGVGSNVLDVTVKANGCYTVQSPPGAVGALYVNDDKGKPFLNPIYAFDGCLGTP
jgi:ABC-2 type transport system permease protein